MRKRSREKTALVIIRDHIACWLKDGDKYGIKQPVPGTLFSLVENDKLRGPGRVADWIITGRYYFWSRDVPDDLLLENLDSSTQAALNGELREAMLCYGYGTNVCLSSQDLREVRDKFVSEWCCPATSGGTQGGSKTKAVLKGLEDFRERHQDHLDETRFARFLQDVKDEVQLYDRIRRLGDSRDIYDAFYYLLEAFIAHSSEHSSDCLQLSYMGIWDDRAQVESMVDKMHGWFSEDSLWQRYADRFKAVTLDEMDKYQTSYDSYIIASSNQAESQRLFASLCSIPQLYSAACGRPVRLTPEQYGESGRILGNAENAQSFAVWASCKDAASVRSDGGDGRIPEFVVHKTNVIWNLVVSAIVGPAHLMPETPKVPTQVVTSVVEGVALGDAIVEGGIPVDIFNISAGAGRQRVIGSIDVGASRVRGPNDIVMVVGRFNGGFDEERRRSLKSSIQRRVSEVFASVSECASDYGQTLSDAVRDCPLWFRHGENRKVFDSAATEDLASKLACKLKTLEPFSGRSTRKTASAKSLVDALCSVADDFVEDERAYLKSEIQELAAEGEGTFTARFGNALSAEPWDVLTKRLYGIEAVRQHAIGEWVAGFMTGLRKQLHDAVCDEVRSFCNREAAPGLYELFLLEAVNEQFSGASGEVPRIFDEDAIITDVIASMVDGAHSRYASVFLAVDVRNEGADTSVSREQLVIRMNDGMAVLENVADKSPSYVKRAEGDAFAYHLLGKQPQQDRMAQMLADSGIVEKADDPRIIRMRESDHIALKRGDVIHMGARTEIELH